ncbi:hypothetical protein [Psychroserpens luteolus]|uniref:hypothetical protein n=1 Tax=Psychroserpens luteolus TaxID=2855840 RepID=UPI001E4E35C6|nr:hypothetical protein [Psychroserpens luteolus]MCD2260657.1 hypothetical protein [Psychroserpens luteolus]
MKDSYKIAILVFFGFLTLMMKPFVPVGGGGISLIFVISIPFLIVLGFVFAVVYYFISKKKIARYKRIAFWLMLLTLITFSLLFYPYAN